MTWKRSCGRSILFGNIYKFVLKKLTTTTKEALTMSKVMLPAYKAVKQHLEFYDTRLWSLVHFSSLAASSLRGDINRRWFFLKCKHSWEHFLTCCKMQFLAIVYDVLRYHFYLPIHCEMNKLKYKTLCVLLVLKH